MSGRGESLFLLFPTLVSLLPLFTSENPREADVKKHISHTPAKMHYFFLICKKVRMNVSSLRLLLLISTSVGSVCSLRSPSPHFLRQLSQSWGLEPLRLGLPACRSGDCTPGFCKGEGMHSGSSVAKGTGVSHIEVYGSIISTGASPADQGTAVGGSAPSLEKEETQLSLLLPITPR